MSDASSSSLCLHDDDSSGSSDDSDSGDEFCEVEVLEEGEREMILVPQREQICCESSASGRPIHTELLVGSTELFLTTISSLLKEDVVRRSPRGQKVQRMLKLMEALKKHEVADIASFLMSLVRECLQEADKHKLPSAGQASIWSTFHRLRSSQHVVDQWSGFVSATIPAQESDESLLCVQLTLDRMLKQSIKARAEEHKATGSNISTPPPNKMESNAIRYMAGYIAVKLLKRYRKRTKNTQLRIKRRLFVDVLTGMRATEQPGEPDSPLAYTELWSLLIDRGGLYHINDDVFQLIESIEVIVRQHLNITVVQTCSTGINMCKVIIEDIFVSHQTISLWEKIAQTIPTKYEKYSLELLKVVAELWINIRGHAFAKNFTMRFEKKYKRGTRKGLKPKKEE